MAKLLIVEDDTLIREALKDKFVKEGYQVESANEGRAGLRLALANRPDLIILDLFMPIMDGNTMLAKLRQDDWGAKVPVIVLTNQTDTQHMQRSIMNLASEYIIKTNISFKALVAKVEKCLEKS
jgi:DNA-binding response OmpR family regulator